MKPSICPADPTGLFCTALQVQLNDRSFLKIFFHRLKIKILPALFVILLLPGRDFRVKKFQSCPTFRFFKQDFHHRIRTRLRKLTRPPRLQDSIWAFHLQRDSPDIPVPCAELSSTSLLDLGLAPGHPAVTCPGHPRVEDLFRRCRKRSRHFEFSAFHQWLPKYHISDGSRFKWRDHLFGDL